MNGLDMTEFDEIWPGGPRFAKDGRVFQLSTDSVMLAEFVNVKRVRRCLDLGSGGGVLSILLGYKSPDMEITGVEIQERWAELSRLNMLENGLSDRVKVVTADLREYVPLLPVGSFDLVVSNPPYFPSGSGKSSPDGGRASAREEKSCTLSDICAAASRALRWGGSLALVHRPERLSEIFCAMTAAGIEPKRLRAVCGSAGRAPCLVLAEGRRGGNPGLAVEAPLILTDADGGDSEEVRRIYHRGEFAPGAKGAETI